jgi:hypothetical protein
MKKIVLICIFFPAFCPASSEYTPTAGYAIRKIEGRRVLVNKQLLSDHAYHHCVLGHEQEYFAECSEAFLGTNDSYPLVRSELQQYDEEMYKLLVKLWKAE